ncbi:MAG: peptidylprolyl isomerase [Gemmatimonadaceae bacterium]|nr:peptidylprolyl isomerase [Gemmatimonadaceae bacterium]
MISPRRWPSLFGLVSAVIVAACSGESRPAADTSTGISATVSGTAPTTVGKPASTPPRSPDRYRVAFETSKGRFVVDVTRDLAPLAADRFYEMVNAGYFTDVRFFRVVPGFVAQFGMHGDPDVNELWEKATLADEPMKTSNTRGTVSFATAGPNTRANQLFVSVGDNSGVLDPQGFAPFGSVSEGLAVVDSLNAEYGEESNNQSRIASQGNEYLGKWFPALDYVKSAKIVP